MARTTKKATKQVKKVTTKKATVKKVAQMKKTKKGVKLVIQPAIFITAAEYEGALKARRVIKNELDPKLQNPVLFSRYCYFNQLIAQYEAQQDGNWLGA